LATNVSLTGGGFTPTFRFDVPEGFVPNAIRIQIFDKSVTLPGPTGGKDIIHSAPMPSGARSYTVPPVLSSGQTLQVGKPYVLAITLIELRPPFTEADFVATNRLAMVLSRSLTFFDFTPSPPPTVMVTSNATIFRPGELLEIDVTVANPGESAAVDVYFGVMLPSDAGPGLGCPGGDAVAFITGASAQVTCLSAPAETFQPFASNVTLPAALPSTTLSDFFKYTWGTTELAGTYTFFLALTPVAAFADGQVGPSDLLAIGAQTVTFDPEP
jgi:uncharacterized repeat protein (TIGR01451 family)